MNKTIRIGIIGLGNMGNAILKRNPGMIAFDKDPAKNAYVKKHYKVVTATGNLDVARKADVVIIAVKPQDTSEVLTEIKLHLLRKLVISIAAGITTSSIEDTLDPKTRVIRVMPNIAAIVGKSISAVCKGKFASRRDIKIAEGIFQKLGTTIRLEESRINTFTAIAGSGPAYFFFFMEALAAAAQKEGFSATEALMIVREVAKGSIGLLETGESFNILRQRVTSKGGTTEAALKVMTEKRIHEIIANAVQAATQRANELSNEIATFQA